MAQKDWPSEDEDFDAVTDAKASRRSVAVVEENDDMTTDEVSTPQEAEEAPQTEAAPEATDSEAEPAVDESPDDTPQHANPEVVPAAAVDGTPPAIQNDTSRTRPGKSSVGRLIFEGILVLAVIGLGLLVWNLSSDRNNLKKQVSQLNSNPQVAIQKQTQDLINHVSGLIQLPQDETPTVASVSDAAKAKQQSAFFNNAQNGDKVLMYVKAGEAILYRPSTNKIVLVAPLTFTNNTNAANTTGTTSKTTTPSTTKTTTTR